MIIWMVAVNSKSHGLGVTAHLSHRAAMEYVKYRYVVPEPVAYQDVLAWVGANTDEDVLVDYDDAEQEPR